VAAGIGAEVRPARPAHTRWNFTVLGADIAFFSLGLAISSAYTILPLFVHHLTANNEAVALIPAMRALGTYVPPLLVAGLVERRRHVLPFILKVTILERVPYLVLAGASIWLAASHPQALVAIFLLMILIASFGGGLTYPGWLDMLARAIPSDWLGRFFGFWSGLGGLVGIGGAALAAAIIANLPWPGSFALCFLLTFISFIFSYVLLGLGREPARTVRDVPGDDAPASTRTSLRQQAHDIVALVREDGGLRRLIASNGLAGIATMAGALFAVAALKRGGLSDAEVGVESTVLFVASTAGNFLWGTIGDRFGHRTVLIYGSACAALAAALAIVAHGFLAYAVVFLLLGLNLSATMLAGFTFITEFGPEERRPTYIALAAVAYAPWVIGAPIVGGVIADTWGYLPVFVISALTGTLAALAYRLLVPEPRRRANQVPAIESR
jgi:MFS family permease